MRPIRFRGKDFTGTWWYGYLSVVDGNPVIHPLKHEGVSMYVDEDTVGQFTGLFDKDGREIYEGDILREPPKDDYEKENYVAFEVFWHPNDCASHHIGWQMNRCHFFGCICGTMYCPNFLPKTTKRMIIIGNIHDNPDLIEKGGDQ